MNSSIYKIGFIAALSAFIATVAFCVVQIIQLLGWFHYPWDEISIYGFSLCITLPFTIAMLALHYITPPEKRFWSHGALMFSIIYVVFVTANYVVQLTTVIPMTLRGDASQIEILVQTPHSLFWDFDAIGYIFMGFATLFAVPVFEKRGLQRWIRYTFFLNGTITNLLIGFVYFYPNFSDKLLFIGFIWAITAPLSMLLLALHFRKFEYPKNLVTSVM